MNKHIDDRDKLYPVTKGNQLIQNSRYNLTLQQQKLVAYAISKIKPQDNHFEWLDITVSDFNSLCGKTGNPGNNDYLLFRDSIMGLSETFFLEELETDENGNAKRDKNGNFIKRTTNVNWFDFELEERINSKGETVASKGKIKLNEKLNKHLIGLKGVYTSYSLQYIMPMRSKFSIRLYEYIKSFSNYGEKIEIDLEELKDVLLSENDGVRDPNKYKKYADFQRRVLDDSIEEINRYTDINVEILEAKKIKRVVYALVFRISFKTQVLDKDNNPVDLSENDLSPALFSYSHGASKPKFKAELLKRVNINCADEKEKQVWDMLQNRYAALANRHTKEDRRIDGGNVQYIDLFNEMIEKDRLESFINAQLDKYASRQWENLLEERAVSNPDAYTRACVKNDIESWQEFLNRSEKTFYETSLADTPEWDISVPKFKVD
ncbi:MAG: replication initiation protein [Oscillospiraceae bacterium]|nr:replication initiation protein [Oscillospiraceae bacterium]